MMLKSRVGMASGLVLHIMVTLFIIICLFI